MTYVWIVVVEGVVSLVIIMLVYVLYFLTVIIY